MVEFKSVLALSTFVTVRVRGYGAVFPRVAFGTHFVAFQITQLTFAPRAKLHIWLRT